jgi:hypothetical protein
LNRKALTVGLILLLIGTSIIPIAAQNAKKASESTSRGNWLYVDGSGPDLRKEYSYNSLKTTMESPLLQNDNWTQIQKLISPDGKPHDAFGYSVSVDGNTAFVGAWFDNGTQDLSGSVYVFIHSSRLWTLQQKIFAPDITDFGLSVSVSGDAALIGAGGAAYIYARNGTQWYQVTKLTSSDTSFGREVSLSGDTAIIGEDFGEKSYVFRCVNSTWNQEAILTASDQEPNDFFGTDVSIDGDTALVSSLQDEDNGVGSGSAYVFVRNGTIWTQQTKLLPSDGKPMDWFGWSVEIKGDTAFIGAPTYGHDDPGFVYVFTRNGTLWTQQQKLLSSDGVDGDRFGCSISLSGDIALIGAYFHDHMGYDSGSAYIFTFDGGQWAEEVELLASDGYEKNWFGFSVSLFNGTALIGAPGFAYVFSEDSWNPQVKIEIQGGLGLTTVITNLDLTENLNDIQWHCSAIGGILWKINYEKNGIVNQIKPGESIKIRSGLIFGLGPVFISFNAADVENTIKAKQIIFYTVSP